MTPGEQQETTGNGAAEWGCAAVLIVMTICVTAYFIARLFVA